MSRLTNRTCLFVRVSTDKQDNQHQIFELTEFSYKRNLEVAQTITTKITGTKTFHDRDDLKRLFECAGR